MVRSKNDTSRRLAVRIAMGCQIGALPCTPFASSRRSPQGETRSMERKNRESYISCTIPQYPPLVVNAVSQSPACISCHMIHKANLVTLTSYSSPKGRYHNPQRRRRCRPLSEANITRRRQAATTLGAQPRQPSHRRRVQERSRHHLPAPFPHEKRL